MVSAGPSGARPIRWIPAGPTTQLVYCSLHAVLRVVKTLIDQLYKVAQEFDRVKAGGRTDRAEAVMGAYCQLATWLGWLGMCLHYACVFSAHHLHKALPNGSM